MKKRSYKSLARNALCTAAALLAFHPHLQAADKTWDGGGADAFWQTTFNWSDNLPALPGDRLTFTGTTRLTTTNNFPIGTLFNGITIANPAGPFVLKGNGITLGGDIFVSQTLVPETISIPLSLSATHRIDVVGDGNLTLSGAVSGTANAGLRKTGDGEVSLTASNTFNGGLLVLGGRVAIATDSSLGSVPTAPGSGGVILNGGSLRSTANMTLDANRQLRVGPGRAALAVDSGTSLTYGGAIINNDGAGGLTKSLFGTLTLFNANTYTGATVVENGTLTLDFTRTNSASANIIATNSTLVMGGANAGLGAASYDQLILNGKTNSVSAQTFNGASVVTGPAVIRVNSGTDGSANLSLGALTHTPGGVVALTAPASGAITTTTPNVNGVLGGWATIGNGTVYRNITMGTELAAVDGTGKIVPYNNYRIFQTDEVLSAIANAGTNLKITSASTGNLIVSNGDGTTTDVNTITLADTRAFGILIGANNTLRLGKYGAIFKSDFVNNLTWTNGSFNAQDVGTLTAGGAPNTDGEIVFYMNNNASQSAGSLNVECKITDNGSGKVSVIKAGPSSMKLRGHNSYSGGLYLLQGRLQFAGTEINNTTAGANVDAGGTGPIYVFPGAYLFPSGVGNFTTTGLSISNKLFIAGLGTDQEQVGAVRFGNGTHISGDVELIGDSRLGGGNEATLPATGISGRISGHYNLDIGALGTINSFISLFNTNNDWTGTTTLNARNSATVNGFRNGASEVIPHGVGKGNVVMNGNTSTGLIYWDLNGFDETINGLSSIGFHAGTVITNRTVGTVSTLSVGDYDQSATFGGTIADGAGQVALTKIGGGNQTFTAALTYTGPTKVKQGTLTLTGAAALASPQITVDAGATLDVSTVTGGFASAGSIEVNGGTLAINSSASGGINNLTLSNATLKVGVDTTHLNALASTLTLKGTTKIDITAVLGITSYPTQFTILKYTTPLAPGAVNLLLGAVPSSSTQGYLSNNIANGSIDLYLVDGPKPLTWKGNLGANWDLATMNWLAFGVTPVSFLNFDSVRFDDSGATGNVNLTAKLSPAAITVLNTNVNYTFGGSGSIGGSASLTKSGTGKLTIVTDGQNDFTGGITVNGGTLQVGTNGVNGTLPAGSLVNNGSLVISRSDGITVASDISGTGGVTLNGSGTTTLSGTSSYDGETIVTQGTLKAGSSTALGSEIAGTTIANGATLDVNGRTLGGEVITVSGNGSGSGAIINTGGDNQNALRNVVLTGNTTFGGTGRWDIRATGGPASLSTGNQPFKIIKTGPNEVSFVNATVDAMLGDVEVQQGLLRMETGSTLGNATNKLIVSAGATFALQNAANALDKVIELNGNGSVASLANGAGSGTVNGSVKLTGSVVVNAAGNNLTIYAPISGSGGLTKTGAAPLALLGALTYTGNTIVNGGSIQLFGDSSLNSSPSVTLNGGTIDANFRNDGTFTIVNGQTLSGSGAVDGAFSVATGGTVSPGGNAIGTLTVSNAVTLSGTARIDLNKAQHTNDLVVSTVVINYGGTLNLVVMDGPIAGGTVFKIFDAPGYSGSFTAVTPATPGSGQTWDISKLAVDGTITVNGTATVPNSPTLAPIVYANGNAAFSGTGGTPNASFDVLSSSDIALSLQNWTLETTLQFNATGGFSFNLPVGTTAGAKFYVLRPR